MAIFNSLQITVFPSTNKLTFVHKFLGMKVIVKCTQQQQQELLEKNTAANVEFNFIGTSSADFANAEGDVFFDCIVDEREPVINVKQLVFVSAVIVTSKELPANCIRINAWNGFLNNSTIEIATSTHHEYVAKTMEALGWKFKFVPDEPGLIAAKVIAMIINEAYFALEDGVSTKNEIDTAMKLGTNYPFGPFEWANKIGKNKIVFLLQRLQLQDARYEPAKLLVEEASGIIHS